MRIDITITHDDGTTTTIASNERVSKTQRAWSFKPNFAVLRELTANETFALSFMCQEIGLRHTPIDPTNPARLRAALAYIDDADHRRRPSEHQPSAASDKSCSPIASSEGTS